MESTALDTVIKLLREVNISTLVSGSPDRTNRRRQLGQEAIGVGGALRNARGVAEPSLPPRGKSRKDLVSVCLFPIDRDHLHALLDGSGAEWRARRCRQFRAVCEGDLGSRCVNVLHLANDYLLFRLRLSQRDCGGQTKRRDQARKKQLLH
jgi:hypothetical protein